MQLWPFQETAVQRVTDAWAAGVRRVLLVAPTGSGKTVMGAALVERAVERGHPVLWVAHRTELIRQAAEALEKRTGIAPAIVAPGYPVRGGALLTVASIQTLVARGYRPPARLVVFDEAHHHIAEEWGTVALSYVSAAVLGLTATPERSDGQSLGGLFDELIVAATYPELVESGHLCPARVFRPGEALTRALAKNPLEAYQAHGENKKAFVFAPSVKLAQEWAESWTAAGIPSVAIDQATPADVRRRATDRFRSGELQALHNVYVLTEGVDIPDAGCVVLGRNVGHQTPYLQMAGRGLRRAAGKEYGILIDLPGCSYAHGLPTALRDYSLEDGIKRRKEKEEALRVCLSCGMTHTTEACPRCGFKPEPRKIQRPTIYDMELSEVTDWSEDKIAAAFRLSGPPGKVKHEFQRLTGKAPDLQGVSHEKKRKEWSRLVALCRSKGYKLGYASHRWKALFGHFPPREWLIER